MPEWLAPLASVGENWERVLLGLAVVLVLTGRIVPKFRLDEARQDRDAWRASSEAKDKVITTYQDQMGELVRFSDLQRRAWDALVPPPREGVDRGTQGSVPTP